MKLRLVKLAFVISSCYLITAALWKPLFMAGSMPGPYWLFIAFDRSVFFVVPLATLVFAISSVVLIFNKRIERKPLLPVVKYSLTCLSVLAAIVGCAWIILYSIAQHGSHVQTLTLPSRTYQLAVYPMFDLNYVLFECDHAWIVCWKTYRSQDTWDTGHLVLDERQQYVNVVLSNSHGEQIIYRQAVK